MDDQQIRERLAKIKALFAGATTNTDLSLSYRFEGLSFGVKVGVRVKGGLLTGRSNQAGPASEKFPGRGCAI